MGDGTEQNPLTHEDVLRLIEEHGGTARGLDLSGKVFEGEIDLRGLNLSRIILENSSFFDAHLEGVDLSYAHLEGANLPHAHLEEAYLRGAHLERANLPFAHLEGADLPGAYLKRANLTDAHLVGAILPYAHLEGAFLYIADFSADTRLENVDWGSHVLGEETKGEFYLAAETYRKLKMWYTNAGIYDTAGEFFFREMTIRRKAIKCWPNPFSRAWSKFISLICGYGERPLRVIGWAASVILGLAAAYYFWGSFSSSSFWDTLYYSAASFTALGYGNWAPQPTGWAKGMGAAEAIIGVFMIALFLITFTRKMTR